MKLEHFLQGLLEAFPISSSMHLNALFNNPQDSAIMHLGSALAFLLITRTFIIYVLKNLKFDIVLRSIILVLPTIFAGFLLREKALDVGAAYVNILCAIVMFFSDRLPKKKSIISLKLIDCAMIGVIIISALIPGVSRMGITFTALRLFRVRRKDALLLTLLVGIPITSGAAFLSIIGGVESQSVINSVLAGIITYFSLIITFKFANYWWVYSIYRILFSLFLLSKANLF